MRLTVSGRSLPELFEDAAHQATAVLFDPAMIGEALREKIVIEAPEPAGLLTNWVNRLFELARDQRMVFQRFHFQELQDTRLRAEAVGELLDPLRHPAKRPLASLQCHQTALVHEHGTWQAELRIKE